MSLTDTHCHLNMPPLSDDTEGVLARAAERGVDRVIVPSYDEATWPEVAALANRPEVFAAYGLLADGEAVYHRVLKYLHKEAQTSRQGL